MTTNATIQELQTALNELNVHFNDNIKFKGITQISSNRVRFTLTVNDSSGPGGRLGHGRKNNGERRKLSAACWHVHGHFFDCLFSSSFDPDRPSSELFVSTQGRKIDKTEGNWVDWNIGSIADPMYFSDACECTHELKNLDFADQVIK